jgi:DNA-binding response OmpR family regulator
MNKILVIEDEANIRANVLDLLDAEGFEAKGVESGRAGLAVAFDEPPSLVICDVMMPELDGWAVLRALRDNPTTANVPFIFLTAKAERSDVRRGMSLGADDYVTKPFTRTELLDAVRARLRRLAQPLSQRQPAPAPTASRPAAPPANEGDVVMQDIAGSCITTSPSTARRSRRRCSRASSSATRRARSPARPRRAPGSSRRPTAAPSSWTRSASCR